MYLNFFETCLQKKQKYQVVKQRGKIKWFIPIYLKNKKQTLWNSVAVNFLSTFICGSEITLDTSVAIYGRFWKSDFKLVRKYFLNCNIETTIRLFYITSTDTTHRSHPAIFYFSTCSSYIYQYTSTFSKNNVYNSVK